MSEANAPSNRPSPDESENPWFPVEPDSFTNPFGAMPEMDAEADTSAQSASLQSRDDDRPAANLASGVENWLNPSESTDLADLISLIQELNQCNSILLDRVSQLEEALERSQNALKAEVKRSHDHTFTEYNPGPAAAQDLAAAQEQAIDLYNQLEFVHQTSQRQQILIETLTGQLETSQERVAELERETALVQQRYNEQTQLLTQAENNNRDLQARLHRQQRYTLQFKVALEKSLDVSTPHYEPVADVLGIANLTENPLLPRVQHIEPWTSPVDISPVRFPWMKLSSEPLKPEPVAPQVVPQSSARANASEEAADLPVARSTARSKRSKLAAVKLPGFQATPPAAAAPDLSQATPEAVDLSTVPNEKLMQKLDSMVQPLADLLAEAVLTEVSANSSEVPDLEGSTRAGVNAPSPAAGSATSAGPTSADDLLNSVMADAEDALWQDLARLIDVSTEEVVKASLSGDLTAFESIDFEALQTTHPAPSPEAEKATARQSQFQQQSQSQSADFFAPAPAVVEAPSAEVAAFFAAPEESIAASSELHSAATASDSVFGTNPGWPAPLIYPTRPAKKRRSLAAVDLPSFLQPQPGPLPT